jgi:Tat protein secretion system quality control protein TatD with DNase activity
MATRSTKEKAEELKKKLEGQFPSATFRVTDKSATRSIGRKVAEREGFQVVEDNGGPMVKAKVTEYLITEVRQCHDCGAEITTVAFGEYGLDECRECEEKRLARQKKELAESIERSRQNVAEWEWRDAWEEA